MEVAGSRDWPPVAASPDMEEQLTGIVARRIGAVALERLAEEPVLLLQGPRSVGKSTLLGDLLAGVAFHLGPQCYTAEDRIHVVAVERLWSP